MLDIVQEQNPAWLSAVHAHSPEWVKSASAPTTEDVSTLSAAAFADPIRRLHPMHNKVAAFLSLGYLAYKGYGQDSPEMVRVKSAARIHGVAEEAEQMLAGLASATVKSAAANPDVPDYALWVKTADEGDPSGYYPLSSAVQVQDASLDICDDFARGKLPVIWYKDACVACVKAARYFGLDDSELHKDVVATAENRAVDFHQAAELLQLRQFAGADEDALSIYSDTVKSAAAGEITIDQAVELAEALDRQLGLKYAGCYKHPWAAFHSGPSDTEMLKLAEANVIVSGVLVPKDVFASIPQDSVKSAFGGAIAETALSAVKAASADPASASYAVGRLSDEAQKELLRLSLREVAGLAA